jgi:RNA polymerase sigma-70 factor (ECF subfamily)
MLRHYTLDDEVGLEGEDIDPVLLEQTKAFLASGRRGTAAEPRLFRAWQQFYRLYDPFIRSVINTRVPRRADREDCLQDTWRDVIAKLPGFQRDPGRCAFRTWLFILARNKTTDVVRRKGYRATSSLSDDWGNALPGGEPDPALDYERRRMQSLVRRALVLISHRLSEKNQRLLRLRWVEERSVKETAAILNLTPQQTRLRDHRMRKSLRQILIALDSEAGDLT